MTQIEQSSLTSAVKYVKAKFRLHMWKKRDFVCLLSYILSPIYQRRKHLFFLVRDLLAEAITDTQNIQKVWITTKVNMPQGGFPKYSLWSPPRRILKSAWVVLQISLIAFSLPSRSPNPQIKLHLPREQQLLHHFYQVIHCSTLVYLKPNPNAQARKYQQLPDFGTCPSIKRKPFTLQTVALIFQTVSPVLSRSTRALRSNVSICWSEANVSCCS